MNTTPQHQRDAGNTTPQRQRDESNTSWKIIVGALTVLALVAGIAIGSVTNWYGLGPSNDTTQSAPTKAKTYEEMSNDLKDKSPRDKISYLNDRTDEELKIWSEGEDKAKQNTVDAKAKDKPADTVTGLEQEDHDEAAANKAAADKAAAEKAAKELDQAVNDQLKARGFDPSIFTRDIDWNLADTVNPGFDAFGLQNPRTPEEMVAALTQSGAIDHLPGDRAANLNPGNWVPVQSTTNIAYKGGMLSIDQYGNVTSDDKLVDPKGTVLFVNVATGAIARQKCVNPVEEAPVPTNEQPTFAPTTPVTPPTPPVTPPTPPVVQYTDVCDIDTGLVRTVPIGAEGNWAPVGSPACNPAPPVPETTVVCRPGVGDNLTIPVTDKRPSDLPVGHVDCYPKSSNPADYEYPAGKPLVGPPAGPVEAVLPPEPKPVDVTVKPGTEAPTVVTAPSADPAPRPVDVPAPVVNAPTPVNPGTAIVDPDQAPAPAAPPAAAPAPAVAAPAAAPAIPAETAPPAG